MMIAAPNYIIRVILNLVNKMTDNKEMMVVADDFAAEDGIGYLAHQTAFVKMIRSVKAKGSFTIGIYGDWGMGKTSMLRQIMTRLGDEDKNNELLTIWFNPWQFTAEEHLIVPFFHTLAAAAEKHVEAQLEAQKEDMDAIEGKSNKVLGKARKFAKSIALATMALTYGINPSIKAGPLSLGFSKG
jgi:predicted KAP-like P-loop ATPase